MEDVDDEAVFYREDIRKVERDIKRITNIQGRQQISGCLFGCIGLIVLGFAVFLINNGVNSNRQSEILEYVQDVLDWRNGKMQEFQNIDVRLLDTEYKPRPFVT